jgi:hypothetical protein
VVSAGDDLEKEIVFAAHAEQISEAEFKITCRIENRGKHAVRVAVPFGDIDWEVKGDKVFIGGEVFRVTSTKRRFVLLPKCEVFETKEGVQTFSSSGVTIEFVDKVKVPEDIRICELAGHVFVLPEASKSNDLKDATGIDITRKIGIVRSSQKE